MSKRPDLWRITERPPLSRCFQCGGWGDDGVPSKHNCFVCDGNGLDPIPWCEINMYKGNEHENYE